MIPFDNVLGIALHTRTILTAIGQDLERGQLDDARRAFADLDRALAPFAAHGTPRQRDLAEAVGLRAHCGLGFYLADMPREASRALSEAEGLTDALIIGEGSHG